MAATAPGPAPTGPRTVSRFEAGLLKILRYFLRQVPAEQALPQVANRQDAPKCLSAGAVHLVRDSLAKGCVLYLAREGGWRKDRFLRNGTQKFGRLWERSPLAELTLNFSRHTLDFLIWITSVRPADANQKSSWSADVADLTPADQLFLFLAYEGLRENESGVALRLKQPFASLPLCRLAYPDDFAAVPAEVPVDYKPWTVGQGALLLEAMQPVLTTRWLQLERRKGQIGQWDQLRQIGQSQERTLTAFMQACEDANRRDLARFLLKSLSTLLSTELTPAFWTGGLQGPGPGRLADRLETQRSALAFLRAGDRMHRWERWARSVSFYEDIYPIAQLWLLDWEHSFGERTARRATDVLRQLEPLRVQQGPPQANPG